jgi:hypothetical protein
LELNDRTDCCRSTAKYHGKHPRLEAIALTEIGARGPYRSKMLAPVIQVQSSRGSLISSVLPEKTTSLQTSQAQLTQEPLIAVLAETCKTSMMNDIQLATELGKS